MKSVLKNPIVVIVLAIVVLIIIVSVFKKPAGVLTVNPLTGSTGNMTAAEFALQQQTAQAQINAQQNIAAQQAQTQQVGSISNAIASIANGLGNWLG